MQLVPGTTIFAFTPYMLQYHAVENGKPLTKMRIVYEGRFVRTPAAVLIYNHFGHVDRYPPDAVVTRGDGVVLRYVLPSAPLPPDVKGMTPAYIVPFR